MVIVIACVCAVVVGACGAGSTGLVFRSSAAHHCSWVFDSFASQFHGCTLEHGNLEGVAREANCEVLFLQSII